MRVPASVWRLRCEYVSITPNTSGPQWPVFTLSPPEETPGPLIGMGTLSPLPTPNPQFSQAPGLPQCLS